MIFPLMKVTGKIYSVAHRELKNNGVYFSYIFMKDNSGRHIKLFDIYASYNISCNIDEGKYVTIFFVDIPSYLPYVLLYRQSKVIYLFGIKSGDRKIYEDNLFKSCVKGISSIDANKSAIPIVFIFSGYLFDFSFWEKSAISNYIFVLSFIFISAILLFYRVYVYNSRKSIMKTWAATMQAAKKMFDQDSSS